ncbi:transcription termination factor 4, mitochondrial [Sabethes cyaneus]|uniref:transcription termination factor 4, mitochondrial n=1 Tax=Sabethes cyaneus TaxID=53552 RepID=UPI00237D366E|nr:transcription termination factor 4, mitochondrial [Sabethes cyaneus]
MFRCIFRIKNVRNFCTQPSAQLIDSLATTIQGLDRPTLSQLFTSSPELARYKANLWQQTYHLMAQEGFETAHFLSIVAGYPDLLARPAAQLTASMDCWRSCQFGDRQMQVLLAAHPQLLDLTDHNQLAQRMAFLHTHFETRKNVWRLFMNSPNVVVDSVDSIQKKIDYVLQRMRIEVLETVKSCAFSAELDHIRCRHVFLERLGLFKPRKSDAEPGELSNNPKLHQITDTTDKRFAVKVAFVTLEEFEVFQELFRKELNKDDDDGDAEFDDVEDNDDYSIRKLSYKKKSRRKQ